MYFLNHCELVDVNSDAPAEGEADVLLGEIPIIGGPQDVLPGHKVQQE